MQYKLKKDEFDNMKCTVQHPGPTAAYRTRMRRRGLYHQISRMRREVVRDAPAGKRAIEDGKAPEPPAKELRGVAKAASNFGKAGSDFDQES